MKWRPPPRLAAALPLLLAALGAAQGEETVDLAINTARVWLTQAQEVAAAVNDATSSAGVPPVEANFTITRAHSAQPSGYMVAASNGQVADIAFSIYGWNNSALEQGYAMPLTQFPFGWAPSEIFYNLPTIEGTPLKLDACAIAGILTGNITSWSDPALVALNPEAALPDEEIVLVFLNLQMSITMALRHVGSGRSKYLSENCPEWTYGTVDNLWPIVAGLDTEGPPPPNVIPSTDVENNWKQVNNTLGAICIGASAPVGQYVALYPNALQYAAIKIADGEYVEPNGELDPAAVEELVALAGDWSAFNTRSPGRYPIMYWGFATLAGDLSTEGARGAYVKDTAGYLLSPEGQAMVGATLEFPLPEALMPAALASWNSIKVAPSDVVTGIPTPAGAAAPAPAPAASSAWRCGALSPLLAAAAVALAVLLA